VGKSKKYHAHTEEGGLKVGDTVEITETRPLSKTKSWTVTRRISEAVVV
jgi:small subunit ribosomal protein S17